jgi:hypothetical protein
MPNLDYENDLEQTAIGFNEGGTYESLLNSHRTEIFVKNSTEPVVGPGSYNLVKETERKANLTTFTQDDRENSKLKNMHYVYKKQKKGTSIRDNFNDGESSENDDDVIDKKDLKKGNANQPGPGEYLSESHITSFITKTSYKPE